MKTVVIDGQGGKLGRLVVEEIKKCGLKTEVCAIGTNSIATSSMLKAGADCGATGENPVIVACREADIIVGPIAILSADSLLGEISPAMAVAVGQSGAKKLLLPVSHCGNLVVGIKNLSLNELVRETVGEIERILLDCEE